MEILYEIIQENPNFYVWAFSIVNIFWGLFLYFNKQRHDRELEGLKNSLKLDSDRRLRVFELKAGQYETYVSSLDAFGKKSQSDLPGRMKPIFDEYLSDYLSAAIAGDKQRENEVISWFSSKISAITNDIAEDYIKIQAESNRLKLTATDEMVQEF